MIIVSVVGARPEFIQAAPVTAALQGRCREILVHTGQHYDDLMSDVFFRDLDLPRPAYELEVGSGSHAQQTARIMERLEPVLVAERPDVVLVRGDTNSTAAAALCAAKLGIAVARIEAGMRSFDRTMPEEINRIVADHVADRFFCVTETARRNLADEGIATAVHVVGDVMYDSLLANLERARHASSVLDRHGLHPGGFVVATIHRSGNTDRPERLRAIVDGLARASDPVIFPLHPRTARALDAHGVTLRAPIVPIPPVAYLDMIRLIADARVVATDSGGVQREAYMVGVPCLTIRPNTEWVETIETGWNALVDADAVAIATAIATCSAPASPRPALFGDGHAAERIARIVTGSA